MPGNTLCVLRFGLGQLYQATMPWLLAFVRWPYFGVTIALGTFCAIGTVLYRPYRNWHIGWLSYLIDQAVKEVETQNAKKALAARKKRITLRSSWQIAKHSSFSIIRASIGYSRRGIWNELRTHYLPSIGSVLFAFLVLALVLLPFDPPKHFSILYHPSTWPDELASKFEKDSAENFSHLFEGLIVVVIALIVFVAESVRTSQSSDEKRVLLRISNLWPLAVAITIVPFSFLYPPTTVATASLVVVIALLTIYGFAQVLLNLLDEERSVREQRAFLRARVKAIIMDSVRQRIGNKILFDATVRRQDL
jgi:hypothetical protein